jgi:hypothetical protein
MAAYCLVLPLVTRYGGLDGTSSSRFVWAVLPLLPALGVVAAGWRHVQRQDEYQRLLLLEGLALGFAVSVVVAVTFGLLMTAGLLMPSAPWWIFGAGMTGWGVGTAAVVRRHGMP